MARHGVRYILAGGFAANLHKYYSNTCEIDIYIDDTKENHTRLGRALAELNLSTIEIIERMQFVPGWSVINLLNGFPLAIMTKVKGLEYLPFDECYNLASTALIEDVYVKFLHLNHLLESKRAAGRPKDLIDILALEEIKKAVQKKENH